MTSGTSRLDVMGDADFDLASDDDDHEARGARILAPILRSRGWPNPWRCTSSPSDGAARASPTYHDRLSSASRATLIAQGGLLSEEECQRFERHPGFDDARRPSHLGRRRARLKVSTSARCATGSRSSGRWPRRGDQDVARVRDEVDARAEFEDVGRAAEDVGLDRRAADPDLRVGSWRRGNSCA